MPEFDFGAIASRVPISQKLIRDGSSYKEVPPREYGDPFRGSQLKDMCPRQEVLCAKHEVYREEEINPHLKMIFALGTGIHEAIQQDLLKDCLMGSWRCRGCGAEYGDMDHLKPMPDKCDGKVYDREEGELKPCPNNNYSEDVVYDWHLPGFDYKEIDLHHEDPHIYSHPDGILWRGDGERPESVIVDNPNLEALEIKSASDRAVEYGYSGYKPVKDAPLPYHKDQLMLYMYILGIDYGRVLYINKSGHGIRSTMIEHLITLDRDYVEEEILADPRSVEEGIQKGDPTVARRVCSSPDCKRSKGCPVSDFCWALDE